MRHDLGKKAGFLSGNFVGQLEGGAMNTSHLPVLASTKKVTNLIFQPPIFPMFSKCLILPESNNSPLNIGHPKRKKNHLPTTNFDKTTSVSRFRVVVSGGCAHALWPAIVFTKVWRLSGPHVHPLPASIPSPAGGSPPSPRRRDSRTMGNSPRRTVANLDHRVVIGWWWREARKVSINWGS